MSIESGGEPLRPAGLRLKQPLRLRLAMWSVSQRGNLFFDFFVVLNSVFICLFVRAGCVPAVGWLPQVCPCHRHHQQHRRPLTPFAA